MNIQNINLIYFSPTGTTRKILNAIATGIGPLSFTSVNLTLPAESPFEKDFSHDELVIIGAPVYAGRIPTAAAERIKKLKGKNTPAVLIVLYGNREFDDALLELKDLSQELGFVPLAAGAFIGEHSFATRELPIANGRPDDNDIRTAAELGKKIRKRMESLSDITQMLPLTVPGNYPYREKGPSLPDIARNSHRDMHPLRRMCPGLPHSSHNSGNRGLYP